MSLLRRIIALAAAMGAVSAMLVGCGGSDAAGDGPLRVMAAASLVDAMTALSAAYRNAHPGVDVQIDTAGSSALVRRLQAGERADVLVTADTATMDTAVNSTVARDPRVIATNELVIVVPVGNPGRVRGIGAFGVPGSRTVLCASEVPCGAAADRVLSAAGETPRPISRSADVRAALGAVTSGEADAAMVYRTDAASARGKVETIAIPGAPHNRYPAALVSEQGRAFRDFLLSPGAQKILRDNGFGRA